MPHALFSWLAAPRPEFTRGRSWFLRGLGLVYLIAFASLGVQIRGLVGSEGILPIAPALEAARAQLGADYALQAPTLCWLSASDTMLVGMCTGGALVSLLVLLGLAPRLSLLAAWALYLSLTVAGREFLQFQWDALLLETGLLAIFLAPRGWLRLPGSKRPEPPPTRAALWLVWWLLFRLMFASGVVKLLSEDEVWWNLTALAHHYETQPLPTSLAWWAHQLPGGFGRSCVAVMFAIELIGPFLIFWPRVGRRLAFVALVSFQVAIAATGNYGFFNALTFVLCFPLLDEAAWRRLPLLRGRRETELPAGTARPAPLRAALLSVTATFLLLLSTAPTLRRFGLGPLPDAVVGLLDVTAPFRSINSYGLFADMTERRGEIVIEGSADGARWEPFGFRWKPGLLSRAPGWVQPHMPRLDWQMWFAALRPSPPGWFQSLCVRLLEGSESVRGLLDDPPFEAEPPHYVRALYYEYRFTTADERARDGAYWKRELLGVYARPISLR